MKIGKSLIESTIRHKYRYLFVYDQCDIENIYWTEMKKELSKNAITVMNLSVHLEALATVVNGIK